MRGIKSFDLYRKVSIDHSQQTLKGGIISLIAVFLMIILFFTETHDYFSTHITKESIITDESEQNQLQVNLDIVLPNAPCLPLSLDQQDSMKTHILDSDEYLVKVRLDKNGDEIKEEELDRTIENIKKVISDGEGCRVIGHIIISRVPGNFHISFHVSGQIVSKIPKDLLSHVKFNHKINHLSFGSEMSNKNITEEFGYNFLSHDSGLISDLKGITRHEYFLKIVPYQFINKINEEIYNTYQYSLNKNMVSHRGSFGAIFFRYDFENVTMIYTKTQNSLVKFIVSLCAILGGTFTLLGLVNKLINLG